MISPYQPTSVNYVDSEGKRRLAVPAALTAILGGSFSWVSSCQNFGVLFSTPEILLWLPAALALGIHSSNVRLKNSAVLVVGISTIALLYYVTTNHSRGYHFMWASVGFSVEALMDGQLIRSLCFLYCWVWHLVIAGWIFVTVATISQTAQEADRWGGG